MYTTQEQYEERELKLFRLELSRVESQPKKDRQEARDEFRLAVYDNRPSLYQSADYLIAGHFGAGAYYAYRRLTHRMNRRAWLFNTCAALDWGCSQAFACTVWRDLPGAIRREINQKLDQLIAATDKDNEPNENLDLNNGGIRPAVKGD